ncbi:MAG: LysM peptidoglycan-binding domain-containing protein [Phycisphaera sp.]|nr:MAG: LysM peptidoglycan-binding domain-containing protein [Phycisphaera sp.]
MTTTPQANPGSFRQTAIGLLALAALWNAVYWLWPVHREAPVVMASTVDEEAQPEHDADPEPPTLTMGDPDPEPARPLIIDPVVHDPDGALGVLPPQFHMHTTTRNDRNLGDIASHYYGDKKLSAIIAQANPFKDPSRLKEGQVWRVPINPDNIQGIIVDPLGNPAEVPPPQALSTEYTEYVVKDNDNFGAISKFHYDTTQHAEFIYAFNKERLGLRSIRSIRPGQVLHIPKEPK